MKKIALLLFVVGLGTLTTNAQVEIKPGVRAGLSLSRLTNVENDGMKNDFYVGATLGIKFVKFYTLQPELTYSRQGAKIGGYSNVYYDFVTDQYITEYIESRKYQLDYLSLGINNKFTFGPGFQVMVGPTVDFKVADNFPAYMSDELIGVDICLMGGLGFQFSNGFGIEARFKQGIVDIFGENYNEYNDDNGNGNIDDIYLNQVFQIGASYTF